MSGEPGQDEGVVLRAEARERADQRFGVEDAGRRREQCASCAHVRLARPDEVGVDQRQTGDAILDADAPAAARVTPDRRSSWATISLPARRTGTPYCSQNAYSMRAPSTQ